MVEHKIAHYYQPTNNSCSQASLAMLFSYFGKTMVPDAIMAGVPVDKNEQGETWGTINQNLAAWCISQGFTATLYTADFQIIDLSWAGLPKDQLLARMEAAKGSRSIPALGKAWSERYMQAYIDFVNAGGELRIQPYMTSALLDEHLPESPLLICVCFNVLHGTGRSRSTGLRQSEPDDVNGHLSNHSVLIYGKDDEGNYLIADPWKEPGFHAVQPERLLVAMTAAQMECDNLFFQLRPSTAQNH